MKKPGLVITHCSIKSSTWQKFTVHEMCIIGVKIGSRANG